jgi:hypothetical protein
MVYSISERKFILETYLKTKFYKKKCENCSLKTKWQSFSTFILICFSNTSYLNDFVKKIIKLNKVDFCQSSVISLKLNSFIC